jgi:hypothetical protein
VCGNGLKLPTSRIDDAVLKVIDGRPAVVMPVVDGVDIVACERTR